MKYAHVLNENSIHVFRAEAKPYINRCATCVHKGKDCPVAYLLDNHTVTECTLRVRKELK